MTIPPIKTLFFSILFLLSYAGYHAQSRTIHVYVALCDNEHQGIVPVPSALGNGKDKKK